MQEPQNHQQQKHTLTAQCEVLGNEHFPFLGNTSVVARTWRNGNNVRYEPLGTFVQTFRSMEEAKRHIETKNLPEGRCEIAEGHDKAAYTVPSADALSIEGFGKVDLSRISDAEKKFHLYITLRDDQRRDFRDLFNRSKPKA